MILNERVNLAQYEIQNASARLVEVVKQEYPEGSRWNIQAGKDVITVEVTGHDDCWWSEPGKMRGFNVITGKMRNFTPSQILEQVSK